MFVEVPLKVLRRITAADGYLDLGMPTHALNELTAIEDAGSLDPAVQFLIGEALKAQERYDDAIEPLQRAATLIPAPFNRAAWLSLSECFRMGGQQELADVVLMFAECPETGPGSSD